MFEEFSYRYSLSFHFLQTTVGKACFSLMTLLKERAINFFAMARVKQQKIDCKVTSWKTSARKLTLTPGCSNRFAIERSQMEQFNFTSFWLVSQCSCAPKRKLSKLNAIPSYISVRSILFKCKETEMYVSILFYSSQS